MERDIGARIKQFRLARDMSQERIEKATGIKQQSISDYERGVSEPSIATLWRLADFFCVTLDDLVGRTPPNNTSEV